MVRVRGRLGLLKGFRVQGLGVVLLLGLGVGFRFIV